MPICDTTFPALAVRPSPDLAAGGAQAGPRRVIGRETFTPTDLEAMAAKLELPLAGPARIAVGFLNVTARHYAPLIHKAIPTKVRGKTLEDWRRAEAAAEKRLATAARRTRNELGRKDDDLSKQVVGDLELVELRTAHKLESLKVVWGSARLGQHDKRDFLGGALPVVFDVIFGKGSIKQRDWFIGRVCQELGFGTNTDAIKQHVTRHNRAKARGERVNLPGWIGT